MDYILFAPIYMAGKTVEIWEFNGAVFPADKLPDYPNDLDAIHDAESSLSHEQLLAFDRILFEINGGNHQKCVHAPASQRAEAFLRCLNMWVGK